MITAAHFAGGSINLSFSGVTVLPHPGPTTRLVVAVPTAGGAILAPDLLDTPGYPVGAFMWIIWAPSTNAHNFSLVFSEQTSLNRTMTPGDVCKIMSRPGAATAIRMMAYDRSELS